MFDQIRKAAGLIALMVGAVYGVRAVLRREIRADDYVDDLSRRVASQLGGEMAQRFSTSSDQATTRIVDGVKEAVTGEIFMGEVRQSLARARASMVREAQRQAAVGIAPVVPIRREECN